MASKTVALHFLFILALANCTSTPTSLRSPANTGGNPPRDCQLNEEQETSLLSLDYKSFDQDPPRGGYRSVSAKGCCREAAQLIVKYRTLHTDSLKPFDSYVLSFHAGQLYTKAGDKELGLEMVKNAIDPAYANDPKDTWNLFVRGTIAFLENDLTSLKSVHAKYVELRGTSEKVPYGMDAIENLIDSAQKGEGYGACEYEAE